MEDFNLLKEFYLSRLNAREEGFKGFILPMQNAREAAVVNNLRSVWR